MKKVTKRTTPYEGDDIAEFQHNNRTHHTASHAFKDVDYANWLEKDPEMSDMKKFIGDLLLFCMPILCIVTYAVILLVRYYS